MLSCKKFYENSFRNLGLNSDNLKFKKKKGDQEILDEWIFFFFFILDYEF